MTRISDKPLAFQALQQRRRERDEVFRIAAEMRRVREQSVPLMPITALDKLCNPLLITGAMAGHRF